MQGHTTTAAVIVLLAVIVLGACESQAVKDLHAAPAGASIDLDALREVQPLLPAGTAVSEPWPMELELGTLEIPAPFDLLYWREPTVPDAELAWLPADPAVVLLPSVEAGTAARGVVEPDLSAIAAAAAAVDAAAAEGAPLPLGFVDAK